MPALPLLGTESSAPIPTCMGFPDLYLRRNSQVQTGRLMTLNLCVPKASPSQTNKEERRANGSAK